MKNLRAKDFILILPAAAILGAAVAALQAGPYWAGLAGFSALFVVGLSGMVAGWRWAGGEKGLAWMLTLALLLRLGAGISVYVALPLDGHNEPDDKAGFVFTDAHRRDDQAWELASSDKPLTAAFDKVYYTDQYGGLLALSALTYRVFSPDSHRPLLILTLAALTAALGVPFLFKGTRLMWDGKLALAAGWFGVIYPESVMTGGAQMREPFLLTFMAVAFWGFVRWIHDGKRSGLAYLGIGVAGMLLVSPAVALAALVLLAAWLRVRGGPMRVSWPLVLAAGAVFLVGLLFLSWSLSARGEYGRGSPVGIILGWAGDSVNWVIYQLERGSGQIQNVFSKLSPVTQFLFVVGYGITQPVLPPAFFAPTTFTWHAIAIFRSVGWYLLLPLLIYAPVALRRAQLPEERRAWLWIWGFCWLWILVSAVRAGGSQWDNPRYRLIFLDFEALVAAYAWLSWRANRDAWLPRILAAEALCVVIFGQWYVARYYLIGIHLPIMVVLSLSLATVIVIFGGGWLWDRRLVRKHLRD